MSDETWAVLDDGWVAARGSNEYDAIFRCVDERNADLAVKILNLKEARCVGLDVRIGDLEAENERLRTALAVTEARGRRNLVWPGDPS